MKAVELAVNRVRPKFRLITQEYRGISLKTGAVSTGLPIWLAVLLSASFPAWSADGLTRCQGVEELISRRVGTLSVRTWQDILQNRRDAPALIGNFYGSHLRIARHLKEVSEEEYQVAVFINAAREGEIEKIRQFLARGMDVNAKNRSGNTALMEACATGQQEVVTLLLDKGADVQVKNNIGENALRKAMRNKQVSIIELFTARNLLKPDAALLIDLILYGETELIEQTLAALPAHEAKSIWQNLLPAACASGSVKTVRLFLDNRADPNQHRGAPLKFCCQSASLEAVRLLLDRGAKVNLWAKKPHVLVASESNRPDVLTLLLDRGAEIDARTKVGTTALMESCSGAVSRDSLVKVLVERGADVNAKNKYGVTALMIAAADGRIAAVRMLLDKGANVNARTEKGLSALKLATARGAKEVVSLLKSRGATE